VPDDAVDHLFTRFVTLMLYLLRVTVDSREPMVNQRKPG